MLALIKHVALLCKIPLSGNALQQSTVGAPLPLFPLHRHSDCLGHPGSLRGTPAGTPSSSDVCAAESHSECPAAQGWLTWAQEHVWVLFCWQHKTAERCQEQVGHQYLGESKEHLFSLYPEKAISDISRCSCCGTDTSCAICQGGSEFV